MKLLHRCIAYAGKLFDALLPRKRHSAAVHTQDDDTLRKKTRPTQHNGHRVLLPYNDQAVKSAIRAMKYENHRVSIKRAAALLRDSIADEVQEQETLHTMRYLLCAVPATQERKREDGFNHLNTMLKLIIADMPSRYPSLHPLLRDERHLLRWTRKVDRQSIVQNRAARLNNVHHAMAATKQLQPNTVCFVIDDVTTTGATLNEARRALTHAGAHTVITLALAH